MTDPAPYRLCLAGSVELRDPQGGDVALGTRKVALLLAILTIEVGWRRRDELGRMVWETAEPEAARVSLRNALHALRKALGPGAIRTQGDAIALQPDAVELEEGEGEFMPGFEEEWAIDRRLRMRALAVARALDAARAALDPAEALRHATRACAIDPLDPEAASLRGELLAWAGRRAEGVEAGRAHRARVVRELGSVPPPTPPPILVENPLLRTFEWTFQRDPNEACALLAATTNQWLWTDVETTLDVHRRVLVAARPSQARGIVAATASFLEIASGRLDRLEVAVERHRTARDSGEPGIASFLCYPLANAYEARGELGLAAGYWEEAVHTAGRHLDPVVRRAAVAMAENALGMFERSIGKGDSGLRRIEAAAGLIEEDGAPLRVWPIRWSQAAAWIERGQFDRAAERLEQCGRAAGAYGGGRFMPWIVESEARLYERMGDLTAARSTYLRMRSIAPEAGEEVVRLADEGLMRVHCGLREYGEATQAWARVVESRRRAGAVPSPLARRLAAPTLRVLRERSSPVEVRTALRRVAAR